MLLASYFCVPELAGDVARKQSVQVSGAAARKAIKRCASQVVTVPALVYAKCLPLSDTDKLSLLCA